MTGEKGVWGFLGTRRIGSAGPPPLDPSTVLRVSGPSPRMDSRLGARHRRILPRRTFRLQHLRPALGGRNDGGRGWGLWKGLSVWTPSRGYNILAPQFKVSNSPLTAYTNLWNAQFSKHPARQSKSWTRLPWLSISMLWTRTLRRYTPSFGSGMWG